MGIKHKDQMFHIGFKKEMENNANKVIPEVKAKEEAIETAVDTTESKEGEEEAVKADFSELTNHIDKLVNAMSKKEAAPMSMAEFGANRNNEEDAVIDRLTNFFKN